MTAPVAPAANSDAQRRLGLLAASRVPPPDLDRFAEWIPRVAALVTTGGRASATLAVRQYAASRAEVSAPGRFTPTPARPAPLEQIGASLRWAAFAPGEADPATRARGVVQKLVLDPGRDTIIDNVAADPHATTYARVPSPGACSFCLLLATRGATYQSAASALKIGTSDRPFHDDCGCAVTPIFAGQTYVPPQQVRDAEDLYAASTGHVGGKAKITEFRRALAAQRTE